MTQKTKEIVVSALRNLMEPIIAMLLRNGVTFKEFSSFCKSVFVEVAARDFGIRGRPTNVSRISVITGIDRKEVKRVKDLLSENTQTKQAQASQDRLSRILSGWHQDRDFLDAQGAPMQLPIEGDNSFQKLVRKYGGDIPVNAILKELLRAGSIEDLGNGKLRVLQRYFFCANTDPQALLRAGTVVNELANTLFHNIYVVDEENTITPRFEGRASNNLISEEHIEEFKKFLDIEGQQFLERIDDWLTQHEQGPEKHPSPLGTQETKKLIRLGVGVFGIEQPHPEER